MPARVAYLKGNVFDSDATSARIAAAAERAGLEQAYKASLADLLERTGKQRNEKQPWPNEAKFLWWFREPDGAENFTLRLRNVRTRRFRKTKTR
jgi:hypothetical protein